MVLFVGCWSWSLFLTCLVGGTSGKQTGKQTELLLARGIHRCPRGIHRCLRSTRQVLTHWISGKVSVQLLVTVKPPISGYTHKTGYLWLLAGGCRSKRGIVFTAMLCSSGVGCRQTVLHNLSIRGDISNTVSHLRPKREALC